MFCILTKVSSKLTVTTESWKLVLIRNAISWKWKLCQPESLAKHSWLFKFFTMFHNCIVFSIATVTKITEWLLWFVQSYSTILPTLLGSRKTSWNTIFNLERFGFEIQIEKTRVYGNIQLFLFMHGFCQDAINLDY